MTNRTRSSRRGGSIYGCLRKRRYDTEEEAEAAATALRQRTGDTVNWFRCQNPACLGYHVGTPRGRWRS